MNKPLDMNSDTFGNLKSDLTVMLNQLIARMKQYKAVEGSVSMKMKVTLSEVTEWQGNRSQSVTIPRFEHKITAQLSIKDDVDGELPGRWELQNQEGGVYSLRPVQVDLFEDIEPQE